jgi:hypothetical protein
VHRPHPRAQAIQRGKRVRKQQAEMRAAQAAAQSAQSAGSLSPEAREAMEQLAGMAELLQSMMGERDAIASQLQAEPDEIDPEAALAAAVKLVTRHGELEGQIEQMEEMLSQRTEQLKAALAQPDGAGEAALLGGAATPADDVPPPVATRGRGVSWATQEAQVLAPPTHPSVRLSKAVPAAPANGAATATTAAEAPAAAAAGGCSVQ